MQLQDTPRDLARVRVSSLLKRGSYSALFAFWFIEREVILDSNKQVPQIFVRYVHRSDSNEIDRRFDKALLHPSGARYELEDRFAQLFERIEGIGL
jgi:hypothetical protein